MPRTKAVPKASPKPPRDRRAENQAAKANLARRVGDIAAARKDGTLGDDYIKLAQAMIMCTLPYSQTEERQITRRARLGDGTYLSVTFNANLPGVQLPFGADRKLLAWIFDRAIRSDSPFITWSSASEYQREMGISMSGRSNQQLAARFERIAGLGIAIQRQADGKRGIVGYTIIAQANLPSSIAGRVIDANQTNLPGMEDQFGIRLARDLYVETRLTGPNRADRTAQRMERLWELTQTPALHQRWDLRFSTITYLPRLHPQDLQRFEYATRIGFGLRIAGMGESVATREGGGDVRVSSLRFWSESPLSLIEEGSGYWRYVPMDDAAAGQILRFLTWYDYRVRFGRLGRLADLLFRPLMGWATAWSFDRLRLWIEDDVPPEVVRTCTLIYSLARLTVSFVWLWHGLVPKLLFHNADELAMLHESGLGAAALPFIGVAEVLVGLAGLLLWRWRPYLLLTSGAMLLALAAVALRSPLYLQAAFNPVTLNLSVFALGLIGWWAWRYTAFAGRCLRHAPGHAPHRKTHREPQPEKRRETT